MERIPEPALMVDFEQVEAYATADFAETNEEYVRHFAARFPGAPSSAHALDLCCGPGDITLRFARAYPGWTIDGVDGSRPMLLHAEHAGIREGLGARLRWIEAILPKPELPAVAYDVVISTGALHHFEEPDDFWSAVRATTVRGALVFVADFFRPASESEVGALVQRHAAWAPEILRQDYENSLRAAFTPPEIRRQLEACGLASLAVEIISDRHILITGRVA